MANWKQVSLLKKGVDVWNSWRDRNPAVRIDLSRADLKGANLINADLHSAELMQAGLYKAKLANANLARAIMIQANLTDSDLTSADLGDANLSSANLTGADLSRAFLSEAVLNETLLVNVDLSTTTGLERCFHVRPSVLDFRTLTRSGPLPIAFLRGCGLPETLINYLPSLLGTEAIQFYSCFISYSTEDQLFANRLHADLQNNGVRCWYAPHNIQGGKKVHEQIDEAIRIYDKLLLILSPASMNSEWVKSEISKARRRETREKRRMLFPLRLVDFAILKDWECFDADAGKDSAREIREYFVPDFSDWKSDHGAYVNAFNRLLKDLKTADYPKL